MLKKNDPRKDKDSGFGDYEEGRGGGTPVGEGTKFPSGSGRGGYKKANEPGHREEGQPRTDDGKFTYNAVNGKKLKEVSKVDGHSRGTTIPPTLTGGVNGVQYYEKDKVSESGKTKKSSHKVVISGAEDEYKVSFGNKYVLARKMSEIVGFDGKIKLSPRDFVEMMQEYVTNEKSDKWLEKHGNLKNEEYYEKLKSGKFGGFKDDDVHEWETKKGRHSAEETEAIEKAGKAGKGKTWVETKEGKKDDADVKRFIKKGEKAEAEDVDVPEDEYEEQDTRVSASEARSEAKSVAKDAGIKDINDLSEDELYEEMAKDEELLKEARAYLSGTTGYGAGAFKNKKPSEIIKDYIYLSASEDEDEEDEEDA